MMDTYETLIAKLKRAHCLNTIAGVLAWDEQVNLPPDSADQRGEQLALLAELQHQAATDPELGRCLQTLELNEPLLTADRRVVVRRARTDYDRLTKLPPAFVREKARHSSYAYHAWAEARVNNDFVGYAPFIAKHLELAQQEATYLGWGDRPYDYAIDKHDPGLDAAQVDRLFRELKAGLLPLAAEILTSPIKPPTKIFPAFPIEGQRAFLREVTKRLGFNYRRGRIDVSLHPFCEGAGADIRMTTRFDEHNPLDSLFSSIHETGHGLYEQGLPLGHQGTPLGQAVGMAVHESQSRLWENQVARGRAFWKFFEPRLRERLAASFGDVSSETLYLAINAVRPTPIRVDADEVTYNLHILLRFELEQRLFRGDLSVGDLPAAWNALSTDLLGLAPSDDRRGVLQDVHWSGGAFGYFPSYCLGNLIAAQLWFTVRRVVPGLEDDFAEGNFNRLLGWLRREIHGQGRRYDTLELVRRVTGEELTPKYLLQYLRERYSPLYRETESTK